MDQEVAKTLGELEIKLQELERELTSIGKRDAQPSKLQAPGKLIDEAVEADSGAAADDEQERAVDNAFGGPAVFGGEEVPAQGATIEAGSAFPVSETAYGEIATGSAAPPTASFPSGVFAPATPGPPRPGPPLPPPAPPLPPPAATPQPPNPQSQTSQSLPPPQPIDRAELVRFKEKLQRTMEELVDEYGKLLLPKPPS
ncbi:MAG: hypothetical protein WAU77_12070 [Solirubrobacteraceae bacterium]|jgi:hypothetical protein